VCGDAVRGGRGERQKRSERKAKCGRRRGRTRVCIVVACVCAEEGGVRGDGRTEEEQREKEG
jgi:hypothetical protein